jgi:hypothetical protein
VGQNSRLRFSKEEIMLQPAKTATPYSGMFAKKDIVLTTIISLSYLLLSKVLIGFRTEQLFLVIFSISFITCHSLHENLLPAFSFHRFLDLV